MTENDKYLSRLREQRGMTQSEVAAELNISRQAVSQWERGATTPSAEKLLALSQLYGVRPEVLYQGDLEEEMEVEEPESPLEEPILEEAERADEQECGIDRPHKMRMVSFFAVCLCCGILIWGKCTNSILTAKIYLIFVLFLSILAWFLFGIYTILNHNKEG